MQIVHLAVGLPTIIRTAKGKELQTAICKNTVIEAYLRVDGFRHDDVVDKKHHGGPDRAVCIYPFEHYTTWNEKFSCELPRAAFGENITAAHMTEATVCIGDIYQIGDTLIQVTQGRIPCSTIDQRLNYPLMKEMISTGYTGYLGRVLKEGLIHSEDRITLVERDPHGVTVLEANEIYFHRPHDISGIRQVLAIEALAEDWRVKFTKRLETALART